MLTAHCDTHTGATPLPASCSNHLLCSYIMRLAESDTRSTGFVLQNDTRSHLPATASHRRGCLCVAVGARVALSYVRPENPGIIKQPPVVCATAASSTQHLRCPADVW